MGKQAGGLDKMDGAGRSAQLNSFYLLLHPTLNGGYQDCNKLAGTL